MIQFGKETSGDLLIRISPDDVGEMFDMVRSANLLQRRSFDPLKQYVTKEFAAELCAYKDRMEGKEGQPC